MSYYDIVIVGAGPAGLAMAHTCSAMNKRILVIDKELNIGGCHRVKRVKGLFTEHGPRIYVSSYVNLFYLMSEMGLKVSDIFTDYKHDFVTVAMQNILPKFSFWELSVFTASYFMYLMNNDHGKNIRLSDYLVKYGFSDKSIEIVDRLCRYTDGGNIRSYSLNKLIRLQDGMFFMKIYQPKRPLDISLFAVWKKFLEKRGVTFLLGREINYIHKLQNNNLQYVLLNDKDMIFFDKLIFAVPPVALVKILKDTNIKDCFGDIEQLGKWSEKTEYINYISITYHFKDDLKLPAVNGLTFDTEWGIVVMNISDYMTNIEDGYKTVLSTAISKCDVNSKYIYKTANECNKEELFAEVYRQIKKSMFADVNLPTDYVAILNPNNYYDVRKNKWEGSDEAYFNTIHTDVIPFSSKAIGNVYNVGTHNGRSHISYTTMESAVSNAMVLATILYPNLRSRYYLRKSLRGKEYIMLFLIIIVMIVILYYSYSLSS